MSPFFGRSVAARAGKWTLGKPVFHDSSAHYRRNYNVLFAYFRSKSCRPVEIAKGEKNGSCQGSSRFVPILDFISLSVAILLDCSLDGQIVVTGAIFTGLNQPVLVRCPHWHYRSAPQRSI